MPEKAELRIRLDDRTWRIYRNPIYDKYLVIGDRDGTTICDDKEAVLAWVRGVVSVHLDAVVTQHEEV